MTVRPTIFNRRPSIEVHIEELLLHGLPLTPDQGSDVQAAVETELTRLLAEQGLNRSSAGAITRFSAGSIQLTQDNRPTPLGHQIGQAIYGGLTLIPASPHPTRSSEGVSG